MTSTGRPDSRLHVLIAMGTRPEIIKLAPVVWAARNHPNISTTVVHSGQHTDLAQPILEYFDIAPDIQLELMLTQTTLPGVFGSCMTRLGQVFQDRQPDVVVTQGDTATAAAISLAAFYARIPVVHVEAGLRTGDLSSPWPEEMNRRVATLSSALHCAPTEFAAQALLRESVPSAQIVITGNPVVDSLQWTMRREGIGTGCSADQSVRRRQERSVVLTAHRRENFGAPLEAICSAVLELAERFPDHQFHFITHPNPNAGPVVKRILEGRSSIHVVPAMSYPQFIRLMANASLLISDSGGIQEEAPTLGVPLLITRESTERPEAVHCGAAKLVGADSSRIVNAAAAILDTAGSEYRQTSTPNPFGDGQSGKRIIDTIWERWGKRD